MKQTLLVLGIGLIALGLLGAYAGSNTGGPNGSDAEAAGFGCGALFIIVGAIAIGVANNMPAS